MGKKHKYSFEEISKLYLKQKKVNTFVDNSSPTSYVTYYTIGLHMSNGEDKKLLHIAMHSQDIEEIINQLSSKIASYLEVEKEVIEN